MTKGEGVKNLEKLMTSFMNGPLVFKISHPSKNPGLNVTALVTLN